MERTEILKQLGFSDQFLQKLESFNDHGLKIDYLDTPAIPELTLQNFDTDKLVVNQTAADSESKRVIS